LDWGLPHLRLGGISSTVLGILVAAAAVAVGRGKLKETPMSASLVLEEGTTVCAGGRSARSVGRIQNYLALEETIIVEIVETVVETSLEEAVAVAVVDITLGASAPPKHSTAMERFKETAEAVTRLADYGATLLGGTVAVETFTAHQGTLTTHGLTMPVVPPMDSSNVGIIL